MPSTAVAMPNAHCLIRIGLAPISRSASWSCATARIARPMKVRDRYSVSRIVSADRDHERDHQPERNPHVADPPGLADIVRGDRALVDAELQDDQDFDDEGDAEEERDAAHAGVAAALFEGFVIQPVGDETEQEEQRRDQQPRQQRIDPVMLVEEVYDVGRQHQEGRMRDVGNVEQAERDRQSEADRRIEAAEQHPDHHRIEQQFK